MSDHLEAASAPFRTTTRVFFAKVICDSCAHDYVTVYISIVRTVELLKILAPKIQQQ